MFLRAGAALPKTFLADVVHIQHLQHPGGLSFGFTSTVPTLLVFPVPDSE
jgi:hypothetical protein